MKRTIPQSKTMRYVLIGVAIAVIVCLLIFQRNPSTAELREVNSLVARAGIHSLDDWKTHTNCSPTGGLAGGYSLEVNDVTISFQNAARLRTAATQRQYDVTERVDGYTVSHGTWSIIVLTKNRTTLFASIVYDQPPKGFSAGSGLCN